MTAGSVVEPERLARYADKFRHAERRLAQFHEWAPQAADADQARLACFKAFQVAKVMEVLRAWISENG